METCVHGARRRAVEIEQPDRRRRLRGTDLRSEHVLVRVVGEKVRAVRQPVGRGVLATLVAVAIVGLSATIVAVRAARGGPGTREVVDGCFAFSVQLAQHAFAVDAGVRFTVTARNTTRQACPGRPCMGITPTWDVEDLRGHLVYRENAIGVLCVSDAPPPPAVAAGARTTWASETWDARQNWQGRCRPGDCHPTRPIAPPGLYRVVWRRLPGHPPVFSDWFARTA